MRTDPPQLQLRRQHGAPARPGRCRADTPGGRAEGLWRGWGAWARVRRWHPHLSALPGGTGPQPSHPGGPHLRASTPASFHPLVPAVVAYDLWGGHSCKLLTPEFCRQDGLGRLRPSPDSGVSAAAVPGGVHKLLPVPGGPWGCPQAPASPRWSLGVSTISCQSPVVPGGVHKLLQVPGGHTRRR